MTPADIKVASGTWLDNFVATPAAVREKYGDDKEGKPNDHCFWDSLWEAWFETDEHFKSRLHLPKRDTKIDGKERSALTPVEIRTLYDEFPASEFFEAMDAASVDECLIDQVLGAGVVQEYANWIYLNLK